MTEEEISEVISEAINALLQAQTKYLEENNLSVNVDKFKTFMEDEFMERFIVLGNTKNSRNLDRSIRIIIRFIYDYDIQKHERLLYKVRKKYYDNKRYDPKKKNRPYVPTPDCLYTKEYIREWIIQCLNQRLTQKWVGGKLKPYNQTWAKRVKHIVDKKLPIDIISEK
jgi:hypothetical protein